MDFRKEANADAQTNVRPIRAAIKAQEEYLANLHNAISLLGGRLDSLLASAPEQPDEQEKKETADRISAILSNHNEAICGAISRLNELIGRLEI